MSIDPIPGRPIIPTHLGPTSEKVDPKMKKMLEELEHLLGPFNHDLGDGKTPGSFSWLADLENPTPEQSKQLLEKFADLKDDLGKIHSFINKPENKALLASLGEGHGWVGGGTSISDLTIGKLVDSFNGLYDDFNKPNYNPDMTGGVDMIESDLGDICQIISTNKPK